MIKFRTLDWNEEPGINAVRALTRGESALQFKAFLQWVTEERGRQMELLGKEKDDVLVRQRQGFCQALGQIATISETVETCARGNE